MRLSDEVWVVRGTVILRMSLAEAVNKGGVGVEIFPAEPDALDALAEIEDADARVTQMRADEARGRARRAREKAAALREAAREEGAR